MDDITKPAAAAVEFTDSHSGHTYKPGDPLDGEHWSDERIEKYVRHGKAKYSDAPKPRRAKKEGE